MYIFIFRSSRACIHPFSVLSTPSKSPMSVSFIFIHLITQVQIVLLLIENDRFVVYLSLFLNFPTFHTKFIIFYCQGFLNIKVHLPIGSDPSFEINKVSNLHQPFRIRSNMSNKSFKHINDLSNCHTLCSFDYQIPQVTALKSPCKNALYSSI